MNKLFLFIATFLASHANAMDLNEYKGKVVLVVNIATHCGFTGQLEGLEKLHQKFKEKGLVVVAVPSNDFGGQTPEADTEVQAFCTSKYGVTFPVKPKTVVKGPQKDTLFKELIKTDKGDKEIRWNFEKFLIGRSGTILQRFSSSTSPDDKKLVSAIEMALQSDK